jgi:hypothetical protein
MRYPLAQQKFSEYTDDGKSTLQSANLYYGNVHLIYRYS